MSRYLVLLVLLGLALTACGEGGLQKRSGLDAQLQVQHGEFIAGAFPSADGGPEILVASPLTTSLRVGQTNTSMTGTIGPTAKTVAIGLEGDVGYWLIAAGGADSILPGALSFQTSLGFSRFVGPGQHRVELAASDASGRFGPTYSIAFDFVDLDAAPDAGLVVSLSWDLDADLDLHVVQPDGIEIWARKISAYTPPVVGIVDQTAADAAGKLDFDSNAGCVIDGRRRENVWYGAAPPSGEYLVRVDTYSMCGQAAARWKLEVVSHGATLATASGEAVPTSTRFPHERGAGALAATFTIP